MRVTLEERFWGKVNKTETCWLWTAAKDAYGYGVFSVGYSMKLAHRVAFQLSTGDLPAQLDHICHNKSCVNPNHLRATTPKQNGENRRGAKQGSTSGYRGVSFHKGSGRWQASVVHNKKQMHLGYFENPQEANRAVVAKRNELFTHNDVDRQA